MKGVLCSRLHDITISVNIGAVPYYGPTGKAGYPERLEGNFAISSTFCSTKVYYVRVSSFYASFFVHTESLDSCCHFQPVIGLEGPCVLFCFRPGIHKIEQKTETGVLSMVLKCYEDPKLEDIFFDKSKYEDLVSDYSYNHKEHHISYVRREEKGVDIWTLTAVRAGVSYVATGKGSSPVSIYGLFCSGVLAWPPDLLCGFFLLHAYQCFML